VKNIVEAVAIKWFAPLWQLRHKYGTTDRSRYKEVEEPKPRHKSLWWIDRHTTD
jgi:hypothetical protein